MREGFDKLKSFLISPDYYDKFTMNLIGSLKKISNAREELNKLNQEGNFEIYGEKLGEIIRLIFFWDF
jgi:hypothetical protein